MGYEIRGNIKAPQHPHLTAKQIQALGGVDVKFRKKRPRPTGVTEPVVQVELTPEEMKLVPKAEEPVSAPKFKSKSPV